MAEKNNVPEIRFVGFTDPWEQRKLGEFSKKITTKNADGAFSETFTNSAEQGVISQLDYFDHDITNDANISGYYVVQPDNFVYNPRISVTAPCGPINRNRLNRAGVMSPLYTVFSVDESVDKTYLEHYFKTSRWHDFMFLEGNSGARSDRFSISDATFFEMPIWCPKIPEQRAIAKQLETMDSLITLHQRKHDKLVQLKKSMLDKMFPKPGETEPEIRFAGFTDPWEQRKLGELYSLVSEKNDLTFGRESIISVANMYFNANVNVADEQYLRTYNVMRLGDIAFEGHSNKEFSHGRFVENYIGDGIVSHIFTVLRPRVPFDVNYWRYAINNEKLMRLSLIRSTKASTMMHDLVPSDFLREAIPTPTLAEQKEIGAFLVGLDHLITLHQRKLELLRNAKKSLLDRMFV